MLISSRIAGGLAAVALALAATAAPAGAQTTQPRNTKEFGLDAGLVVGLGDISSVQIALPTARARIGYFLANDSRWSLEPAVGLNYIKVEGGDGALFYNLEAGALYHFAPPSGLMDVAEANRVSVVYARPFINLSGVTGDGGDSEFSAGGGLGVKIPWRSGLAWRLEANAGYGFDNEAFRLGAFAGISFFTR